MELVTLPIWGQYGLLGLSLGLNITWLTLIARGMMVSHKLVDQANATTQQVQNVADTFRQAWETESAKNDKMVESVNKLVVQGETTLRILEYREPIMHTPGEDEPDVES